MVVKTSSKYASTVTEQYNSNFKYNHWDKPENAIGYVTNTVTTGLFTKEKYATHYKTTYKKDKNGKEIEDKKADKWDYKYSHPYTLSAHDFRLEIPDKAVITKVKFEVRMRATKSNIPEPSIRFNLYGTAFNKKSDTVKSYTTGFYDGVYYVIPTKSLGTSFDTYTYEMDYNDVKTAKATISNYNATIFGIDLIFHDAFVKDKADNKEGYVSVQWVRCTVTYNYPDSILKIKGKMDEFTGETGTESNPHTCLAGDNVPMVISLGNGSSAPYGTASVTLTPPDHSTISVGVKDGTYSNNVWTSNLHGTSTNYLNFDISQVRTGLNSLKATICDREYYYYFLVQAYDVDGDGYATIKITPSDELHHKHKACLNIRVEGYSADNTVGLTFTNINNFTYSGLTLDDANCINVDSMTSASSSGATVKLSQGGDYVISLNYCGYPSYGIATMTVTNTDDPTHPVTQSLSVKEAYTYVIGFKPSKSIINNHRVITDLDTNASIVSTSVDNVDAVMIMDECTLSMDKWDDLDYIGCIPLEHLHFDPQSTYKDTLLDSRYKNKRYMGKKLASDEDITLNVRLHPQQVTTLQGLIDMDKPIPINANHKCFEGDALNHRGWAEIYGVKTTYTNPHWYKCDIDVKYLTHNLNTRFKIHKGIKSDDSLDIPSLMTETFSSGDNLSDMSGDAYFKVDTDGTFYYNSEAITLEEEFEDDNENNITYTTGASYSFTLNGITYTGITDINEVVSLLQIRGYDILTPVLNEKLKYKVTETVPEYQRNNFSLDNGQYVTVTTSNPLTHTSTVDFTWSTVKMDELRENAVSRVVRLLDKDTSKVVFEYEYDNLVFTDDEVTGGYIYRYLQDNGSYFDGNGNITFRYNPDDVTSETDESVETEVEGTGEAHYGSTFSLILNNGKLSIRDAGFNGREVAINDMKLVDGSYIYQVEWINNNMDDDTSDVDCIFDFRVQDTILTSTYADKWGKLVVSPFPVADKKILFTRLAEEGTIYYYTDDGEEFSYMVEPYYQYLNGTDLVYNGSSIFNLNYGYQVVYIQNGLVRLGFNRLNGELYLGKYDPTSESYITVSRMHLSKFDDVNLNSITDDKIEVQASDCTFTIWRGHPYIKVKHELEDITIDTQYNSVWAEQVGKDEAVELPAYWELMNDKNLLPSSVGGSTTLKPSDVEISSQFVDTRTATSLSMTSASTKDLDDSTITYTIGTDNVEVYTGYDITFTITDTAVTYNDSIDLDDTVCSFGTLEWSETCDITNATAIPSLAFDKDVIQSGDKVQLFANVTNPCNIGVNAVRVDFYEVYTPSLTMSSDTSVIQSGGKAQICGILKDEDGSLVKGQRVDFYEVYTPSLTMSSDTSVIQSGGKAQICGILKDEDGSLVKGQRVDFYIVDDD